MSAFGEVHISFNDTMKTNFTNWNNNSNYTNLQDEEVDTQNLGVFNESVINIKVIPALNR